MPYNTILIPLDGSTDSLFALETAMNFVCASPSGRTFHLVHCVEPIPNLIGGENREELQADQKNQADMIFTQAQKLISERGFVSQIHQREGSVGDEIAAVAKESGSEIIVMGTHGISGLKSLMLGSVSSDVLRQSPVPVLLASKARHE